MSDAFSDIARSNENAILGAEFLNAQKSFLSGPTRESLRKLYEACDRLSGCRTGYWGDNPGGLGKGAKEYFTKRFKRKRNLKVGPEDISYFLGTVGKEYRLGELSELLALSQGVKIGGDEFGLKSREIRNYLESSLTILQEREIHGDSLTGEGLARILRDSEFDKKYKLPYKN